MPGKKTRIPDTSFKVMNRAVPCNRSHMFSLFWGGGFGSICNWASQFVKMSSTVQVSIDVLHRFRECAFACHTYYFEGICKLSKPNLQNPNHKWWLALSLFGGWLLYFPPATSRSTWFSKDAWSIGSDLHPLWWPLNVPINRVASHDHISDCISFLDIV